MELLDIGSGYILYYTDIIVIYIYIYIIYLMYYWRAMYIIC